MVILSNRESSQRRSCSIRAAHSSARQIRATGMVDTANYDFKLPKELIAQRPVATRSDARLMVVDRGSSEIHHAHVRDLADWLKQPDCLTLNNSRVLPARLDGYRISTRGRWQGLFLSVDEQGIWKMLCKTRGRLKDGEQIMLTDRLSQDDVQLRMITRLEDGIWAARPVTDETTWALLDRIGRVPLPHYIRHGEMIDDDLQWYQTVYAEKPGSVAAPTAGLHLTQPLLQQLEHRGVQVATVTLHIGMGTFRPIAASDLNEHQMHFESGELAGRRHRTEVVCSQSLGRPHRGRRYDDRSSAGNGCRRRPAQAVDRIHRPVHQTRLRIPCRRRLADEFPPAKINPAGSGTDVRRR